MLVFAKKRKPPNLRFGGKTPRFNNGNDNSDLVAGPTESYFLLKRHNFLLDLAWARTQLVGDSDGDISARHRASELRARWNTHTPTRSIKSLGAWVWRAVTFAGTKGHAHRRILIIRIN